MKKLSAFAALSALFATPALAHHPLGGATPATLTEGLLSGLGHPVIGFDHLAFVVAVGLAAAMMGRAKSAPLAFVAATVIGCLLAMAGVAMPGAEIVIAGSVLLLGALVLMGRMPSAGAMLGFFAVAGLFHGGAYAAAIIGAETTPVLAYLGGFALVQYAIAAGVAMLAGAALKSDALKPRLAGAVVAGVGATFLVEQVEALVFTAI